MFGRAWFVCLVWWPKPWDWLLTKPYPTEKRHQRHEALVTSWIGFVDFILKCLNDLCELIGWGDGDSVSLVLFRIKDCQVVVAGLVRLLHFTRETFRLISDSFVLSLYNSSGVLVFVVLVFLLVDGELHFVEGFSTRKVAWKTGNDGLSNEFFAVIVFMCAEGLELSWHLLFNINII